MATLEVRALNTLVCPRCMLLRYGLAHSVHKILGICRETTQRDYLLVRGGK